MTARVERANKNGSWLVIQLTNPLLVKSSVVTRRPASILNAVRVLVICLCIELLGFAFSGDYSTGRLIGVVVGIILLFWLLRLLHAGMNWSRYVLVGLIVLGVITSAGSFATNYPQHPGETVIDCVSTLLSLIAAVLLLGKQSNAWFRSFQTR